MRLFGVLDRLGENVLYFDTDSIIFKTLKSDDLHYLPIGNYLGELTNEITPEDGHIVEFVSGGPKIMHIVHSRVGKNVKYGVFYVKLGKFQSH